MDPDAVKSTLWNLAFGNVMAAAARELRWIGLHVGFQDLGAKDDFTTKKLENLLVQKGMPSEKRKEEEEEEYEYQESICRSVRSSGNVNSDSD